MQQPPPMLRVSGLARTFGRVRALDGISFSVEPGSVIALLGANGAGKTTTLKCVLGVIPFEGTVEVDGTDVRRKGKEARRRVGYVPQLPALSDDDTCRQALTFIAELKGAGPGRIDETLELVNLREQRDAKVMHLSGGMRQRLALAAALLADPPLLLLDEPTASLDVESRRLVHEIIGRLRGEGKTVILSTHFLDRIDELVDRVLILHEGRLAFDGTMDELARRARGNRFVVNLNGNAPSEFIELLRGAGIGPERVQPAELRWEEILTSPVAEAARGGKEETR